jgi:hypothetical protein
MTTEKRIKKKTPTQRLYFQGGIERRVFAVVFIGIP